MSSPQSIALLFLDGHPKTVPMALVETIVILERSGIEFTLYDPVLEKESDWEAALVKTFSRIRERVVLVSFSSENHFFAVGSLIFLSEHIDLLQAKQVHVCLPVLSLFGPLPFQRRNVVFHKRLLNEVVCELFSCRKPYQHKYVQSMALAIRRHGYAGRIVSGALNPDCRYHCVFCFSRDSAGGRGPNDASRMDRIMQLMDVAVLTGAPFFKFTDPNFIDDTAGVMRFIGRWRLKRARVVWHCSARLDLLNKNKKIYGQMVDHGCEHLLLGVEHVVRRIVASVHKGEDTLEQLSEFLTYWDHRTTLSLSFMTGFQDESADESRMNLDFIKRLRKIRGVHAYLGYYMLFREEQRKNAGSNYLIGLVYLLHMVPPGKNLSLKYARILLKHCMENTFFSFYHQTVNSESLRIISGVMQAFARDKTLNDCMPEIERFIGEMPDWTGRVMRARSLAELNHEILYAERIS